MKILAICSYKGTLFSGWQKQTNNRSVQQEIEDALTKIYNQPITIYGSGRTDAGVHAISQYFHFEVKKEKDLDRIKYSLNKMLDDDIQIKELKVCDDDFHARFSAKRKIYEYRIRLVAKSPLSHDLEFLFPQQFDFNKFKDSLNLFVGEHSFVNFTSKEEDESNFIRNIYSIDVNKDDDLITIIFNGNGFMRYQIRFMVGAALAVASNNENIDFIKDRLTDVKKRNIISYKVPSQGLYLKDVIYF